jgi:hypothetical protein
MFTGLYVKFIIDGLWTSIANVHPIAISQGDDGHQE